MSYGKRSRDKGKRGERELANVLTELGFKARRGVQFSGGPSSPDVVVDAPGLHFECKRAEKLSLWAALAQAKGDAGSAIPIVAHRANHKEWVVVMELKDFMEVYRESSLPDDGRPT